MYVNNIEPHICGSHITKVRKSQFLNTDSARFANIIVTIWHECN